MPRVMTGGCLCGRVRYSAEAEPLLTPICYCTHCQKQSGAAFSVNVVVPRAALSIEGEPKTFEDRGASGRPVHRRFCPDCGSPVVSELDALDARPGVAFIKAGTLDDTGWLRPTAEIWCESEQPWVRQGGERRRFPQAAG